MSREEDPPLYRLRWRCGRPPDPRELRKESRQWYARRERASRRAVCLLNFERRGFASAPLTTAPPSRRYNSFSGRDGVQSAHARAPQAHRAAVSARFPPATARYRQAEGTKPNTSSVAKRARDDVVANDARTTPALEKQNPRPTLRYVVPSRGDVPPEAEKENGGEPEKASAKRPAAKRQKAKSGAPLDDPKQVTLSQAFAVVSGATSPETTTRASEGVATPESIDDIELAPVAENAETRRKKPRDDDDDSPDDDVSPDPFVLFGERLANVSNVSAFAETFARAMRTASAFSIGVLFRDVVGSRRFGFRSNASPEPDAPRKEAARKAARAAGGGAPPPEGGWQAAVRRVPSAVGVLPLGADVPDAGDGVGGVMFAFPVGEVPGARRGDPRAHETKYRYSLRPEHAAALASALRAGTQNPKPAVAFHAQAVFKALSALGVRCEPLLARLTVLDARAMAWLHAPDAPHEGGVEEVWRSCFPADARVAARDGGAASLVTSDSQTRDTQSETAFGAFRRDLASAAALTQRFRRATQGDALLRANPDLRARFARTTRRECRVAALLGAMEHAGIGFDVAYARRVVTRFRDEIETVERAADALAVVNADGSRVNLAAPAQVATALFQTLRLPAPPVLKERGERGGAQLSTRDEVLRALASGPNAHPLVGLVVRHRAATRAAATCASYVSTYEKQNGSSTEGSIGRLRCEWNNTRTATGRLSSSNPNLQAVGGVSISEKDVGVPLGADDGDACVSLRGAFVAPEGRVLLAADYSQIELRVLASLARDSRLLEIFALSSADAFERIWNAGRGFPASAPVTRADRAKAKTTVYGLLYGQGEAGLAHKLGVTREEARDLTRALYAAFPSLRRFIRETREDARRRRGAFLPLAARLRPLPGLVSADASARAEAERRAVNTLVQGTAADLVKLAMERWCRAIATTPRDASPRSGDALPLDIEIPAGFDPARVSLIAQIHDELMFEVDGDARCVEATAECARACMEGAAEELGLTGLWTPTKVTVGKTWETLVPIEAFLASARANAPSDD